MRASRMLTDVYKDLRERCGFVILSKSLLCQILDYALPEHNTLPHQILQRRIAVERCIRYHIHVKYQTQ